MAKPGCCASCVFTKSPNYTFADYSYCAIIDSDTLAQQTYSATFSEDFLGEQRECHVCSRYQLNPYVIAND